MIFFLRNLSAEVEFCGLMYICIQRSMFHPFNLFQIIDEKSLIKKYQREISTLKTELDQLRKGMLVGVSHEEILTLRQKVLGFFSHLFVINVLLPGEFFLNTSICYSWRRVKWKCSLGWRRRKKLKLLLWAEFSDSPSLFLYQLKIQSLDWLMCLAIIVVIRLVRMM